MNHFKPKLLVWLIGLLCALPSVSLPQPNWLKQVVKNAATISPYKDAIVITLYDSYYMIVLTDGSARINVRQAHKILKEAGEYFGELSEPISPFRKIKNLKGWAIVPEGKIQSLERDNILEVSVPEATTYYDDSHLLIARLPDLKVGNIVAFEFDIEEVALTGSYQRFIFQGQQPVKLAQFSITLPKDWQLYHSEWHSDKLIYQQDGNRYTWTAKDLPYQPEEPLMPSWFWLSPRVAITYFNPSISNSPQFTNWQTVAKWCADKHQEAAIPDETVQAQTRQLTQALSTPEEQLQAIAAFVRDEIRYVAVEIGEGQWQPRPASVTLYNRYGDCKDKTALMRAMLQTLNIQSCSVLANTHYSVLPKLPSPFQFNHCIVGIPLASLSGSFSFKQNGVSGWLFFDPTDQSMRLGDLPTALQGGRGLLATQADSVLIQLPYQSPYRGYLTEGIVKIIKKIGRPTS